VILLSNWFKCYRRSMLIIKCLRFYLIIKCVKCSSCLLINIYLFYITHLHICTHLHIYTFAFTHLHILHIYTLHLHIYTFTHLHITHLPFYIYTFTFYYTTTQIRIIISGIIMFSNQGAFFGRHRPGWNPT
jgi:hypothetical protein